LLPEWAAQTKEIDSDVNQLDDAEGLINGGSGGE
jgi:hypothetical protein